MRDTVGKRATRRDMRREATKAAVLEAARVVFLRQGFEGATIKAIADEADVSPGTVLNAEPTKAALLVSILQGECDHIAESAEQLESALSGSARDRMSALLQLMLDGHLKQTELFAAAVGYSWLESGQDFQDAFERLSFVWEPVRRTLQAGMASGEFDPELDEGAAMHVLVEVFYSALREAAREAGTDPRDALTKRVGVVMSGLRP